MISHISSPPKALNVFRATVKVLYITNVMKLVFFEDDTVVLHSLSKHLNTFHISVCCFALIHSSSLIFQIFLYCIVLCVQNHMEESVLTERRWERCFASIRKAVEKNSTRKILMFLRMLTYKNKQKSKSILISECK